MAEQTKKTDPARSSTKTGKQSQQTKFNADERPSTADNVMSEKPGTPSRQMSENSEGNGNGDSLMQQVRSTATEAYDSATSKAAEKLEEQKTTLSGGLSNVATNIRKFSANIENAESGDQVSRIAAEYSQLAANKLEQAVGYFDRKDLNDMYRDVEVLARNHPAWFIGGAFAIGFFAARFLKSSNARSHSSAGMSYSPNMPRQQPRSGIQTQVM